MRLLLTLLILLITLPAFARSSRPSGLSSTQRAQVRREIRAKAQWHFTLFQGRRPSLRTVIRPVAGTPNQFTASALISANWRGSRAILAENQFTITREPNGRLTVRSPQPFIPR